MTTRYCTSCKTNKSESEFYITGKYKNKRYLSTMCKECKRSYERNLAHKTGKNIPLNENIKCPHYLGSYIAENLAQQMLISLFTTVDRMPYRNSGYDFYCDNSYKIDVKSSSIRKNSGNSIKFWEFDISKNTVADYFLCMAFDNRIDSNLLHVWLINGNDINHKGNLIISTTIHSLNKWSKYEKLFDRLNYKFIK